jgi:methylmalonyl-CoA mutase N-terminal domain/subunit
VYVSFSQKTEAHQEEIKKNEVGVATGLAWTEAGGDIIYVEAAIERGLKVDDFAPRLSFFFDSHIDFFEEIAKFRAARTIWAKIMRENAIALFGLEASQPSL